MTHTGPGTERLGSIAGAIDAADEEVRELVPRIWERDHTVWQPEPDEVADRLGWLDAPTAFAGRIDELTAFADEVVADGFTDVLLVGMGGSSLYPEVLARTFGSTEGHPRLTVLDSTDPAAVARAGAELPPATTLLVVSSKSGTTIETRSHLEWFWSLLSDAVDEPGRHVVAITDPGSELVALAEERGFRRVFENPADIGGRFSALSYFGLVPAALLGVDLERHLAGATAVLEACRSTDLDVNGPARLGAVLGVGAEAGRWELTLVLPRAVEAIGDWIEQLVAESTGKHGVGILPIVGEPVADPDTYDNRRLFVSLGTNEGIDALAEAGHPVVEIPFDGAADLGGEVVRWEFATAVAGALLGVNPFDQPDVQSAKTAASRVLDEGVPDIAPVSPADLLRQVEPGDYVAITAFVDPGSEVVDRLESVRLRMRDLLGVPVTLGIGPRYLHSTGQLHKGGPERGVFIQVVGDDPEDVAIPGRDIGFSTLKQAQAAGDLEALQAAGRRAGRVDLDALVR
ncbi:MAG: glucose-6-phosphate isomerase [Actinobacteria bacterium]|nr:glucose-6-phosphate isomerase [Actinomycetota bacterium]